MFSRFLIAILVIILPGLALAVMEETAVAPQAPDLLSEKAYSLLAESSRLSYYAHYDRSIVTVRQAKALFEELKTSHCDTTGATGLARCILLLGKNYRIKSDVPLAKHFLHPGLDSCRVWFGANSPLTASFYEELGQLYFTIGDFMLFRQFAQEGLDLRRKLFGQEHPEIAESLNSVGLAEIHLGNTENAGLYFRRALAIRTAQKPEPKLPMAESYHGLYLYASENYKYDEAGLYAQRMLTNALAAVGKNHPLVAEGYIVMGNYYYSYGEIQKALANYRKAHAILLHLFGPLHYRTIATLTNMASCYAHQGEYAKAVEYHHQARKVTWQLYGENAWYAFSCTYLGQVYEKQGNYDEALRWYEKSLAVQMKLGPPSVLMLQFQYNEIARIYLALKKPHLCLEYLDKTFSSFHPIPILDASLTPARGHWPLHEIFINTLLLRAEAYRQFACGQSNLKQELFVALDSYRIAMTIIEKMPAVEFSEDANSNHVVSGLAAPIYDGAVRCALSLSDLTGKREYQEAAFEFVQRGKAAILARSLQEANAKSFASIPDKISRKETVLNQRLGDLRVALRRAEQQGVEVVSQEYEKLRTAYFDAQQEQRKLISQLESIYPAYHALKYQTVAATVNEQQAAMDDETALLDFYLSDSTLYVFAITADRFITKECGPAAEMVGWIGDFRAALKSDNRKNCQQLGGLLYRQLILPVWPVIGKKKNLVIFPHDKLFEIPFETLVVSSEGSQKPTYLLHHFRISYHYSARTYSEMEEGRKGVGHPSEIDLLALAPFPANNTAAIPGKNLFKSYLAMPRRHFAWITRDGESFCELPGSEVEVDQIAAAFTAQKARSTRYIGPQATKTNFMNSAGTARFVHLATHSFVNESSPTLSGIAFSSPSVKAGEHDDDTILYAGEVYNLELNADLVVLSSCESGIGKLVKGEGMIALTRGFLYAGARNVMVSLWKASDQYATELMPEFYRRVLGGESFSAALRSAKLAFLKKNRNASPAMWGCFILYGR